MDQLYHPVLWHYDSKKTPTNAFRHFRLKLDSKPETRNGKGIVNKIAMSPIIM
jgi:hypothetical protein